MTEGQHDEPVIFPICVDDDTVVTDSELVGLHGAKPGKKPLRICRHSFEFSSDSLFHRLFELAVSPCRKFGELDLEGQAFIPLP